MSSRLPPLKLRMLEGMGRDARGTEDGRESSPFPLFLILGKVIEMKGLEPVHVVS